MNSSGSLLRLAAFVACSLISLFFYTDSASAAGEERLYEGQITGLHSPSAMTVDGAGNLWVADAGNGGLVTEYSPYPSNTKIDEVDGEGHFGSGYYVLGLAVSDVTNDAYVANSAVPSVQIFDSSGAFVKEINENVGGYVFVAVDNSGGASNGDIYVSSSNGLLQKFDGEGNPVNFSASASYISGNKITGTPAGNFGTAWKIVTDSSGRIYVIDNQRHEVDVFDSTGTFLRRVTGTEVPGGWDSSNLNGLAVDPLSGNLLVVNSNAGITNEFGPTGTYLRSIVGKEDEQKTPFSVLIGGIALDPSGFLYLGETNYQTGEGPVDVFSPNRIFPSVSYSPVSDASHTSVTTNGSIDLNGGPPVTSCEFVYGTTTAYGSSAPCSPATPYASNRSVQGALSGLAAEKTYHYRLIVETENGVRRGTDQTFYLSAVYGIGSDPASNLVTGPSTEGGGATLNGSYLGDGNDTTFRFEYVPIDAYNPLAQNPYAAGHATASTDAGSGSGVQHVSSSITRLTTGTRYHYRLVATNQFGTSYGPDEVFISAPANAPSVTGTSASGVTDTSATLEAQVNPGFGPTVVRFKYGPTSALGSQTFPTEPVGADGADHRAAMDVSELAPGTTYHYRAVATNFSGTVQGPDETFTTPEAPTIAQSAASGITGTSATLSATVRPGFRPTTYHFEYGITSAYGARTPESGSVGADNVPHTATADVLSLAPGVTYHFRMVATNSVGTSVGPDQSFTTPFALPPTPGPKPSVTCRKGLVRRRGKCVRPRHRKSKPHKHRRSHR